MTTDSMLTQLATTFGAAIENSYPQSVAIDQIDVKPQERERFDEPENTITVLSESIKLYGVLQPILLRPANGGRYELVAGERRLRAAKMAKLTTIPCLIKKLDDAEARDARLTENIQRLNLTMMEEAKALKNTLNDLKGDRAQLSQRYGKSAGWISARLSLLDLPPQAARLVAENRTADVTAINNVKQIEKVNPEAAKKLVDSYVNKPVGAPGLREASEAVRKEVKPESKAKQIDGGAKHGSAAGQNASIATPRDRSAQEPSSPVIQNSGGMPNIFPVAPQKPHEKAIANFVLAARKPGADGPKLIAALPPADVELIEKQTETFFKRGQETTNLAASLVAGLSKNEFGSSPVTLMNLVAFLQGQAKAEKFTIEAAAAVIGTALTST